MPLTATECFEGHPRPEDAGAWLLWVCPEDDELVIPADLNWADVASANRRHPLLTEGIPVVGPDVSVPVEGPGVGSKQVFVYTSPDSLPDPGSPHPGSPDPGQGPSRRERQADPNDTLLVLAAPILAGFSLAAIVMIGTSARTSRRPAAAAAIAFFAAAAVFLVFSIQMLVVSALPGLEDAPGLRRIAALLRFPRLNKTPWTWLVKGFLYEIGLLSFLIGLGLFLWTSPWSAAAIIAVAVVGLAVVADLALLAASWFRQDWGGAPSG
jgi:hypothetical protein